MSELYLMRAELDCRNLLRWSAEQRHSDTDRTAHCLMMETFGSENSPNPFVFKMPQNGQRMGTVLGYTRRDEQELVRAAEQEQRLVHTSVLNPDTIRTVPVPDQWYEGQQVGFEIRIFPTKRSSNRDPVKEEKDYFLGAPEGMSRSDNYCGWLADRLKRQGALLPNLEDMRMTEFSIRRIRRNRTSPWQSGPDATIRGTATVVNPELMLPVLEEGIGRHKGYGYGMLLLRNGRH